MHRYLKRMLPLFLLRVQYGTVSMVETASRAPPFIGRVMVVLVTMDSFTWYYDSNEAFIILRGVLILSHIYVIYKKKSEFNFKCLTQRYPFRSASSGARFLQCLRRDFWKPSRWALGSKMFIKGNFLDTYSSLIHIFPRNYEEKYKKSLYKMCKTICADYAKKWRSH